MHFGGRGSLAHWDPYKKQYSLYPPGKNNRCHSDPGVPGTAPRAAIRACDFQAFTKCTQDSIFRKSALALDKPRGVPGTPGSLKQTLCFCNANHTVIRQILHSTIVCTGIPVRKGSPKACPAHVLLFRNAILRASCDKSGKHESK